MMQHESMHFYGGKNIHLGNVARVINVTMNALLLTPLISYLVAINKINKL